jgi:SNF2 family DNA or RNA helicase
MNLRNLRKRVSKYDPNENFVIELDKYWPYGLKYSQDPENPDLLFIHSQEFNGGLYCRFCDGTCNETRNYPIELVPLMKYCSARKSKIVPLSDHEEAHKEFVESHDIKAQRFISVNQLLRPKCCDKDCLATATIAVRDIKFSNLYRYFYQKNTIIVYLKLDPESEAMIPFELGESFASTLKNSYLKAFWGFEKNFNLSDTLDIPKATVSREFKLKLREYQLRSINWMKSIEAVEGCEENTIKHSVSAWSKEPPNFKIKLGHTGYFIGFKENEPTISASPNTENRPPVRIYGGILADDTGSGKTITTLGLIDSHPFSKTKEADRIKRFPDLANFCQSRASLILCPDNIQHQWVEEAKRCNPKFNIVSFIKMEEVKNFSLNEIMEADLIVTSYQFLVQLSGIRPVEREGIVELEKVHFYRLILDEFHELTPTKSGINFSLKKLRADHIWGLTGTPNITSLPVVLRYFRIPVILESILTGNIFAHNEFVRKFIKRNEPDLNLPPIKNETIWVEMKSSERILHDWKSERASHRTKLMMCSHYQLADKPKTEAFMTLEQVKSTMITSKQNEVERYQLQIMKTLESIQNESETTRKLTKFEIDHINLKIESIQRHLDDAQRRLNYCLSVFKVIEDPNGNECRICFETIDGNNLALLPCSHVFCYDCVTSAISFSRKYECPLCRQFLPRLKSDIFKIVPEDQSKTNQFPGIMDKVDVSKYSSKMIALCKYLIELIESEKDAKIILFLQYKELGDFISEVFDKELELKHVRVAGSADQRQNAIKNFRESNDVRIIMLSSEDSVSGINLTEATHVILLHPFFTDQGEETDLAYEKQGISRAYRFGLNHPLKVIRFAVKGTVEEEITLRRMTFTL